MTNGEIDLSIRNSCMTDHAFVIRNSSLPSFDGYINGTREKSSLRKMIIVGKITRAAALTMNIEHRRLDAFRAKQTFKTSPNIICARFAQCIIVSRVAHFIGISLNEYAFYRHVRYHLRRAADRAVVARAKLGFIEAE